MSNMNKILDKRLWVKHAFVDGRIQDDVLLSIDSANNWALIAPNSPQSKITQDTNLQLLDGLVLPGVVNAHSHAFQRAILGQTERASSGEQSNFWTWRNAMYDMALRVSPDDVYAIAKQLYTELLAGGFTHVCEFHYLHNDINGKSYANPLAMSLALVQAAQDVDEGRGIGLTLLPTLYMQAGFSEAPLGHDQRRFASTPQSVLHIAQAINALKLPKINAGVALHSLRAVGASALQEIAQESKNQNYPVHIHISEQMAEVESCKRLHKRTPIEYLQELTQLDSRWNLVHATHATKTELEALVQTKSSIVLCPNTEANLGDGIFDADTWLSQKGSWSIGTDSHVSRSLFDELKLLEYCQRLKLQERNVFAKIKTLDDTQTSTGAALLQGALAGGAAATGLKLGTIKIGNRADYRVIDTSIFEHESKFLDVKKAHWLDALVFGGLS